jgi:hypothetical protein
MEVMARETVEADKVKKVRACQYSLLMPAAVTDLLVEHAALYGRHCHMNNILRLCVTSIASSCSSSDFR